MEHIQNLVEALSDKLTGVAQSDVVVGDPIELDGVTVVPLSRVSVGFGGGGGEGEGEMPGNPGKSGKKSKGGKGKGTGGGSGGGAKVRPVGVLVFTDDGVEVQAIKEKQGLLDKIFDKVPDIIDLVEKYQDRDTEKA